MHTYTKNQPDGATREVTVEADGPFVLRTVYRNGACWPVRERRHFPRLAAMRVRWALRRDGYTRT